MSKAFHKMMFPKHIRSTLLIIAIILMAGTGYGLVRARIPVTTMDNTILYNYSLSVDGSYTVKLVDNELYPEGVLGEDGLYARNLIDRLDVTFAADYAGNRKAPVSVVYSIEVSVQGYQLSGDHRRVIYERKYPLVQDKQLQGETNLSISEPVSLDINQYREFTDKAEQILNSKPAREARAVFSGVFTAQSEFGEVKEPFTYTVAFPLTNDLFSITKERAISKTDYIAESKEVTVRPAPAAAALPAFGLFVGLAAVAGLIFFVRPPTDHEQHVLSFKAVLRKHGSRMVRLKAFPPFLDDEQIEIADLDSLIKISDERQHSICYLLNPEGLPTDGLLFVPSGERYYVLYLQEYSFRGG